jgi:hypothetical protein
VMRMVEGYPKLYSDLSSVVARGKFYQRVVRERLASAPLHITNLPK